MVEINHHGYVMGEKFVNANLAECRCSYQATQLVHDQKRGFLIFV